MKKSAVIEAGILVFLLILLSAVGGSKNYLKHARNNNRQELGAFTIILNHRRDDVDGNDDSIVVDDDDDDDENKIYYGGKRPSRRRQREVHNLKLRGKTGSGFDGEMMVGAATVRSTSTTNPYHDRALNDVYTYSPTANFSTTFAPTIVNETIDSDYNETTDADDGATTIIPAVTKQFPRSEITATVESSTQDPTLVVTATSTVSPSSESSSFHTQLVPSPTTLYPSTIQPSSANSQNPTAVTLSPSTTNCSGKKMSCASREDCCNAEKYGCYGKTKNETKCQKCARKNMSCEDTADCCKQYVCSNLTHSCSIDPSIPPTPSTTIPPSTNCTRRLMPCTATDQCCHSETYGCYGKTKDDKKCRKCARRNMLCKDTADCCKRNAFIYNVCSNLTHTCIASSNPTLFPSTTLSPSTNCTRRLMTCTSTEQCCNSETYGCYGETNDKKKCRKCGRRNMVCKNTAECCKKYVCSNRTHSCIDPSVPTPFPSTTLPPSTNCTKKHMPCTSREECCHSEKYGCYGKTKKKMCQKCVRRNMMCKDTSECCKEYVCNNITHTCVNSSIPTRHPSSTPVPTQELPNCVQRKETCRRKKDCCNHKLYGCYGLAYNSKKCRKCAKPGMNCKRDTNCCNGGTCDFFTRTCLEAVSCVPDEETCQSVQTCCHEGYGCYGRRADKMKCLKCAKKKMNCKTTNDCCKGGKRTECDRAVKLCVTCKKKQKLCTIGSQCCSKKCRKGLCL